MGSPELPATGAYLPLLAFRRDQVVSLTRASGSIRSPRPIVVPLLTFAFAPIRTSSSVAGKAALGFWPTLAFFPISTPPSTIANWTVASARTTTSCRMMASRTLAPGSTTTPGASTLRSTVPAMSHPGETRLWSIRAVP